MHNSKDLGAGTPTKNAVDFLQYINMLFGDYFINYEDAAMCSTSRHLFDTALVSGERGY